MRGQSWLPGTSCRTSERRLAHPNHQSPPLHLEETLDQSGVRWQTPLECVESVRAKKAFRAGTKVLEVFYKGWAGQWGHTAFERTSVAAWANTRNGTNRAEPNSFQNFEAQILAAREARFSLRAATPAAGRQAPDGSWRRYPAPRIDLDTSDGSRLRLPFPQPG